MQTISSFCRVDETEYAFSTDRVNLFFYDLPKYYCDEYRSYDAPRFCTILNGSKEVSVNNSERFVYNKDKFILLPPYSTVNMCMPDVTQALVYEFSCDLIDSVRQQVADNLQINLSKQIDYSFFQSESFQNRLAILHQRIQDILKSGDNNLQFLIDITCQELIYELLKMQGCHDILHHYKSHPIHRALQIIKSDHENRISISDIASELNMSLASFSQKFKLMTNYTPKEYITKLRVNRSKQYLKSHSVTETAYEAGYENISHYIRLFKKEFGMTPKQFQLKISK